MKRYIWFAVSCVLQFFAMFFTGMFIINMFVLFFLLVGRTKDLSIMDALDALKISSVIITSLMVLILLVSGTVREEFSKLMKFYAPKQSFHAKRSLGE